MLMVQDARQDAINMAGRYLADVEDMTDQELIAALEKDAYKMIRDGRQVMGTRLFIAIADLHRMLNDQSSYATLAQCQPQQAGRL